MKYCFLNFHFQISDWCNFLEISFNAYDLISNTPYCLPYNSYDASSENLVLDQLENPKT